LLHRIIGNLVDNAVQHTEHGGILIACRNHAGKKWLEVWDTGSGIPEDKTAVIFEEFRQLGDDARNRGSGLGLAIVAKTAALLGLQIRLRSRLGRGSMFAVELPQGSQLAPVQNHFMPQAPRQLRIALVEDNPEVLQALVMALQSAGHEVIAAKTGKQLLESLLGKAPDMIISDYRLAAAETGFHVISAVRAVFGEDLPALLITGDTDPSMVRFMADQGITVQYKPLQFDRLQAFIASATGNRQSAILN
jgi:CheY-like chemotaxis protein